MSEKCMAVYLTVSEIQRQKWTGGSFYPPLAGIRVNRHLTLIKVTSEPNCPLCQEEEETVLHLLGRCSVLALTRLNHLGSHRMGYNDLSNIRWLLLLKLANASGRFS